MSDYLIFGSVDSRNYGVYIFPTEIDDAPKRAYKRQEIAGRSGDLLIDQKRYENIQMHYYGFIVGNSYDESLRDFRAALMSQIGYQKLEDSVHTAEYYDACYIDTLLVETASGRKMGRFEMVFNRKPQRWLKSGDNVVTLTSSGTIENPTYFESNPLIRVYGTGKMYIGSQDITISSNDEYTDIDCFLMEAYKGAASKNANVEFGTSDKPVLAPGINNIQLPNTITRVEITPRWYTI